MEVRIKFESEVYISGDSIEELNQKWCDLPIFCADALEDNAADVVGITTVERVDDDSYEDLTYKFK